MVWHCRSPGCGTRPCFGYSWKTPLNCMKHRDDDMINVVDKFCETGCGTRATFGFSIPPTRCPYHALPGMTIIKPPTAPSSATKAEPVSTSQVVDVRASAPQHTLARPQQQPIDVTRVSHALSSVLPSSSTVKPAPVVVSGGIKTCEAAGCTGLALYTHKGGDTPRWCVTHKDPATMIYVGTSYFPASLWPTNLTTTNGGTLGSGAAASPQTKSSPQAKTSSQTKAGEGSRSAPRSSAKGDNDTTAVVASNRTVGPKGGKICEAEGCTSRPSYGVQRGEKARFCAAHRLEGYVNVVDKLCEGANCPKTPSFGFTGHTRRFCAQHSLPGMVNLRTKNRGSGANSSNANTPTAPQTRKRPAPQPQRSHSTPTHTFSEGETSEEDPRAHWSNNDNSRTHTSPYAVAMHMHVPSPSNTHTHAKSVSGRVCEVEGCSGRQRFGYRGSMPRVCGAHKAQDMINLVDRLCEQEGCDTSPSYAFMGEKRRFCVRHAWPGMVSVVRSHNTPLASAPTSAPSSASKSGYAHTPVVMHDTSMYTYENESESEEKEIFSEEEYEESDIDELFDDELIASYAQFKRQRTTGAQIDVSKYLPPPPPPDAEVHDVEGVQIFSWIP